VEAVGKGLLCFLFAYLILSLELGQILLSRHVYAQDEAFSSFLWRLEGYLRDAMPSESAPMNESEYVIPEGLNPSQAEEVWRRLGPYVSMGFSRDDLRHLLNASISVGLADGSVAVLNFSALDVERPPDGSVRVKVPIICNGSLKYLRYNSTNLRVLYDVWNETLVRYYRVERFSGLYSYTLRDLRTGKEYSIRSRLQAGVFSSEFLGANVTEIIEVPNWGLAIHGLSSWVGVTSTTPVVAVPGHYEDLKVLVPEHEKKFKVLFPAYDPAVYEGWLVDVELSSTSLAVGEVLRVSCSAFPEGVDPDAEPLDANLSLLAPGAFEVLGGNLIRLDNPNRNGSFELRALQPGTYNLTLKLQGNACFNAWPTGSELSFTVQVVAPGSPSVSVSIAGMDTSALKRAKLKVELRNSGGGAARNLFVEVTGSNLKPESRSIGDLEAGVAREEPFDLRLLQESSSIVARVSYRDDDNNSYLVETRSSVWSNNFFVPEHFEEHTAIVPEHEETVKVFVPGYEGYTHVRFYAFVLDWMTSVPGVYVAPKLEEGEHYGGFELHAVMMPCSLYGFELDVSKDMSEVTLRQSNVSLMLTSLEPCFDYVGTLEEADAAELIGVSAGQLRKGELPKFFRSQVVGSCWRNSSAAVTLNSTEFELYKARMAELRVYNEDIRYNYRSYVNATRASTNSTQASFAAFVYHPLNVKGSGPLTSIQVKNYAARNMSYELRVSQFNLGAYYPLGKPIWEVRSYSFLVRGMGDDALLASSLASSDFTYVARLFNGCNLVAEVVFSLYSEPSPFWECFWEEVRGRLPWILATSTIIVLVGFLTGHSTTAAYAGLVVSIVSTAIYLVGGTALNWEEIEQCREAYSFYDGLAESFRDWSYELSNYTPYETGLPLGPPTEAPKPFEPKGPLAALYWNYSLYFRGIATRILEDTVLDLVVGCGITDFETAMNPNASECVRGRATGRIVSAALSFTAFVIATKIASIEAKAANTKTPWSLVSTVKAWATPAIYDLAETLVRNRGVIAFIVKNPGQALQIGKFLLFRGLKTIKGKALDAWESAKSELKELVGKIESGAGRVEDFMSMVVERLKSFADFHDEMHSFAKDVGQEEAMDVSYMLDGGGIEVPKQTEILRILREIATKSRGAARVILEFLGKLDPERLRETMDLKVIGKIGELEESVLEDVGKAWRLDDDVNDFSGLLKGLSMAQELGQQRQGEIFTLFHRSVETGDGDDVAFISRVLGWISEARKAIPDERRGAREDLTDGAVRLANKVLDSGLDRGKMIRITGVLENLLKYRRDEIGPHEVEGVPGSHQGIFYSFEKGLNDAGLGKGLNPVLLEDCLSKWGFASKVRYAYASSCGPVGDDFRGNVPFEMNYLMVSGDKCIPVIAASSAGKGYTVTIPNDAVEYLRSVEWSAGVKYLRGDEGFLIFVKDLPQGAGEIAPVKVDENRRISLTEWFEKTFGKRPEYAKYFDENGRIRWGELDNDHMTLVVKVSKDGQELYRTILLKPSAQGIIRTRVGEIAGSKEIVECEFTLKRTERLSVEEALDIFTHQYEVEGKVAQNLAGKLSGVMLLMDEEGRGLTNKDKKGDWVEWRHFQVISEHKHCNIEGYQVWFDSDIGGTYLDFIISPALVEVKYSIREEGLDRTLDQIAKYKKAREARYPGKDIVFSTYEKNSQEDLNLLVSRLREGFGEDLSWLKICNGIEEFKEYLMSIFGG